MLPTDNACVGSKVQLTINGKLHEVSEDVASSTSLVEYLREFAHLKGTKFMCLEGGCGACIVSAKFQHPETKKNVSIAVNSCLIPIFSCHGWSITTIEGLGNGHAGYHKIQKRLAAANGTQCGYCTPGMIMNMNSLLEGGELKMKQVENSFGGNICRCTGYRPILDAFKSLAIDAPPKLVSKLSDIEDMVCPNSKKYCSGGNCLEKCTTNKWPTNIEGNDEWWDHRSLTFNFQDGGQWFRPLALKEVYQIFDMIGSKSYRLVAGNTAKGVYPIFDDIDVFIDINGVGELHGYNVEPEQIVLGANINLTEAMDLFRNLAKNEPNKFTYCHSMAEHIDLIANVPVRNVGSLAGNLTMKHTNKEFPSDLLLMLEMVGTKLQIGDGSGVIETMGILEYLAHDMHKKLIIKIILPVLDNNLYITQSYKIMPRAQNAHAYVNAGFCFKVDKQNDYKILARPTILFGGINPDFLHATNTETYLWSGDKKLLDGETLKQALHMLESELKPDNRIGDATPEYRQGLALSLFYKFVLSVDPQKISAKNRSGGPLLQRPISTGHQDYQTDPNLWPLNKPIPKIEALLQCAGETEYTNDIPSFPGQLWGQLVLCDRARATITSIDPSEALRIAGVRKFLCAKDIPGKNTFACQLPSYEDELVFVDIGSSTDYAGQAVGVIIADSYSIAKKAAAKVKIIYSNPQKIWIDMREIIDKKINDRITMHGSITPKQKKTDIKYKVEGRWDLKTQYHYTMETQGCVAVPVEGDLEVYATTQWPQAVQEAVSLVLNIPQHRIFVRVRRLGGGYGAKITRTNHVSVVSSLAAHLLHRPVRIVLDLPTNMEWCGKRFPVFTDYQAGVNEAGQIQYLSANIYQDDGHVPNDSSITETLHHMVNLYESSTWDVKGFGVKTDTASNTWCRAPGSTEAISIVETILEHIANVVTKDPIDVKIANMKKTKENPLPQMIVEFKKEADFDERCKQVKHFNLENRWKKRGMSLVPMSYPFGFWGGWYAMVSIYRGDGTVAISHGGIEMGQGLNTKAAQVAAHVLNVDLEYISIKATNTVVAPNNAGTGGSLGSEATCYAIKVCCEELNKRLEPYKKEDTWKQAVDKAFANDVSLNTSYMFTSRDDVQNYSIYGIVITEVEVDILTGQYHTRRVDIVEDAGQSLSPEIDIGQVEGAFIMGLGYFTTEESIHRPDTGAIFTKNTWTYKPPGVKDIPIDFRITLKKNAPNPTGVLSSKATGEPPFCLSCSVTFAIRNALESARHDATKNNELWFDIEPPFTVERIWLGALTKKEMFTL